MPGDNQDPDRWYLLDTNTISETFRAFYRDQFPSFWQRFDKLVLSGTASSVLAVRRELENARRTEIVESVQYLLNLNRAFFSEPNAQEQLLVAEMLDDGNLLSATSRWKAKASRGIEDADPYLIAKARFLHGSLIQVTVVTEENPGNPANVPATCQRFGIQCINLQSMMSDLGWQF